MFFKKEERGAPGWREGWNRKQQRYARRLADYLGRKASTVPRARMRVYVVIFLLAMAGLDLAVTLRSMREHRAAVPFGEPQRVLIPPAPSPPSKVDLRACLDSLLRDSTNGRELDSLLRARPGLVDSFRKLEGMEP